MLVREGQHIGVVTNALTKSAPSWRKIVCVFFITFGEPSTVSMSSTRMKIMLGRLMNLVPLRESGLTLRALIFHDNLHKSRTKNMAKFFAIVTRFSEAFLTTAAFFEKSDCSRILNDQLREPERTRTQQHEKLVVARTCWRWQGWNTAQRCQLLRIFQLSRMKLLLKTVLIEKICKIISNKTAKFPLGFGAKFVT